MESKKKYSDYTLEPQWHSTTKESNIICHTTLSVINELWKESEEKKAEEIYDDISIYFDIIKDDENEEKTKK